MTMDEAREMVLNAQTRLVQLRQMLRQMDGRLAEAEHVLDLLARRLVPPVREADGADGDRA
jgi:hypothetical protein